jgi:excisionase family DNA binding protein
MSAIATSMASSEKEEFGELLTVDEVAALFKVSKSWVYEHTRSAGRSRSDRLPHIKLGKYVRFHPQAVQDFLRRATTR